MSNYDRIGTLYDKAEKLIGVRYSVYDAGISGQDWIEAIEMRFETGVATVYVESDFDTLRVELGEMQVGADCFIKDAATLIPWDNALGRTMGWI